MYNNNIEKFYLWTLHDMPDNKNQGVEANNHNETTKRRSFFGGEINEKTKDLLDFRYNTQEEIDKLNDEMTTTTDLDEMIRQTNNINGLENNKEVENINKEDEEHKEDEDYLRQKDEQDAEFGLEKDLQGIDNSSNNNGINDNYDEVYKEKEEPIEGEVVENPHKDEEKIENEEKVKDETMEEKIENESNDNIDIGEDTPKESTEENKKEEIIKEESKPEEDKPQEEENQKYTEEEQKDEESQLENGAKFFDPFELNLDADDENPEGNNQDFDPFSLDNDEIDNNEGNEDLEIKDSEEEPENIENEEKEDNEEEFEEKEDEEPENIENEEIIEEDEIDDNKQEEETEEEIDEEEINEQESEEETENQSEYEEPKNIENEEIIEEDEIDNNEGDEDLEIKDINQEETEEDLNEEEEYNEEEYNEEEFEEKEDEEINEEETEQNIYTNEEKEMEEDDDDEIVINTPISVNPNDKNEKEEMPNNKKIKKNSATGEIITDEEIQLEQGQDTSISEDDEEYRPSEEELFEQEPEFFANDELSQQFLHLVQNVRGIFKLEHKDGEQDPYFKILGGKTEYSTLEYLFYLIEEKDEPIDLYIKKVETDQETGEENEHLVQFSYNEDKELNIFVDEVILYERINKSDPDTPEYNDTKAILEKFIFLTDNHYDKLKAQINKEREERQKKKQLQQIFKGF